MKRLCYVLSTLLIFTSVSAVFAKAPKTAKIVFRSMRDGNSEIYTMNPDGSDQKNLTRHRANDIAPIWAPTGREILFQSDRGGIPDLYLMDPDGTNVRQVFKKLIGREFPTWSPDGKTIAYHRFHTFSIYTASIDGTDETKLTEGLWPAWSPDGSEIAFMTGEFFWGANGNLKLMDVRIKIINLHTHVISELLPRSISMFSPTWAPDGTQLAFSWNGRQEDGFLGGPKAFHAVGIYVVNRDGSGLREIIDSGEETAVSNPTWSPDGTELIYDMYNPQNLGFRQLFRTTLDGGAPKQLTRRDNNLRADWFDPTFALSISPQPFLLTTTWGKLKTQD